MELVLELKNKKSGFTLIELLLLLSLSFGGILTMKSIFRSCIEKNTHTLTLNTMSIELHKARSLASALDADTELQVSNNNLLLKSENSIKDSLTLPHIFKYTINNKEKLGFKSNYNTKFSGTLFVENQKKKKSISLGVGLSKIKLKQ